MPVAIGFLMAVLFAAVSMLVPNMRRVDSLRLAEVLSVPCSYDRSMETEPRSAHVQRVDALASAVTDPSRGWALCRDLLAGLAIIAGLWLTVVPVDGAGRVGQVALAAAALGAMLLRGRWSVLAAFGSAVATGAAWVLGLTADPFVLTGFAVFVVAERQGVRRFPLWLFAGAGAVLLITLGFSAEGIEDRFRGMMLGAVVLAGCWVLGVRTRQARREEGIRSRAVERLRLARDVHDVLSHSLGTIGVQAGVAAHVSTLGEPELRGMLRDIETNARGSLIELKALLQRERIEDGAGEADTAVPSLALTAVLADIAQNAERSGLRVRLELDGEADELSAAERTTAHRVVQEAVTNVIRHASASSLLIAVQTVGDRVEVTVRDDGRTAVLAVHEGHGLIGMRERVALLGGTLDLEATPDGFVVSVSLPIEPLIDGTDGGS